MNEFGIKTISDLDNIISQLSDDIYNVSFANFSNFIYMILAVHNPDKYFSIASSNKKFISRWVAEVLKRFMDVESLCIKHNLEIR